MPLLAQLGLALVALAAWYGVSSVAAWRRLRHVPGPALASFSYAWAVGQLRGQRGEVYEALGRRYGPVVRVGPRQVLVSDADAFRHVNGARAAHPRDTWYWGSKIDADQDTTFSALAPAAHDQLKAKVAAAYAGRAGVRLEPAVDRLVARLVAKLRADHLSTDDGDGDGSDARLRPLDLAHFVRYFTLDVITETAYGRAWGFLDGKDDEYKYTESIEALIPLVATAAELPALRKLFIFPLTRALFAPKRSDKTGFGRLLGIAADIIHKRYASGDQEGEDMTGGFIRHGMTEKESVTESLIQITAGSDTTATVIRTTMLYIMTTPRVYQRLREEMRAAIAAGQVSSPITNEEAKKLPYLQATIYEGIRMRPPAVYGFYKQLVHAEELCGLRLPAGTAVGHNGPAMMRDEVVFGPDAQVFRPERLLLGGGGGGVEEEERRAERWRVIDLAFGHGRWTCAGRTLAMIELNKVYFELLRAFDFQIIYPGKAWSEKSTTLWSQSEMWTRVTEASPMDSPQ